MNITKTSSRFIAVKPDNRHFKLNNGIVTCNRAGFQINAECPREYKAIISECINNGWLTPIAHVTEEEYMVMQLSN